MIPRKVAGVLMIMGGIIAFSAVSVLTLLRFFINAFLVQAWAEVHEVEPYKWGWVFENLFWCVPAVLSIVAGLVLCTSERKFRLRHLTFRGAEELASPIRGHV